jgi:hypothetical protein
VLILAATGILLFATLGSGIGWVVGPALLVPILVYFGLCWLRPFTTCRHRATLGVAWRCNACDGTGRRVRKGRALLQGLRDTHRPRPPK